MEELFGYIVNKTKGFFPEKRLDVFFGQIEKEAAKLGFTKTSWANLERIIKAVFDIRAFVSDAISYPHYVEIVAAIAHHSNFLTDVVVRNPGVLYRVLTPSFLQAPVNEKKLDAEIDNGLKRLKRFESSVRFLRKFKNANMLVIAVRDLLGMSELETVTSELSMLARAVSRSLFKLALDETAKRKNLNSIKNGYVMAALGKLGGNELNYSSDIDLIFFYEKNRKRKDSDYDLHELLSEAITLFANASSESTPDGFLYRVDFRLRPDGKYSPLVKSRKDYVYYYETRGENWERQMLLKLDFVAGSKTLFRKFEKDIEPFVFPSQVEREHFAGVRKMKEQIEKSAGENYDIKKIEGGIRDVEFSVQVLQTVNGKRNKEIRTRNTLEAIRLLYSRKLLSGKESEILETNYSLFRKAEHYLQLMDDIQTHTIPEKGERAEKLSAFLGYASPRDLFADFNLRRKKVREIFNSVTLQESRNEKQTISVKFKDEKKAARNLRYILTGESLSGGKSFDKITLERAAKIEQPLLRLLSETRSPDIALESFAKILSVSKFPSIFLRELSDTEFLKLFIRVCENSELIVNSMLNRPEFAEEFVSRTVFSSELQNLGNIEKLRFSSAVRLIPGTLSPLEVSEVLSEKIKSVIKTLSDKFFGDGVFVAALGSLARNEMNFYSDADLLIIAEGEKSASRIATAAERFLTELKKEIAPFTADLRLRPEGESSQLVWNIEAVEKYFEKRLSAWELIAFSKARFVAGNIKTFSRFAEIYSEKIASSSKSHILRELKTVYAKLVSAKTKFLRAFDLKFSHGGITTADFVSLPETLFENSPEKIAQAFYGKEKLRFDVETENIRKSYLKLILALQITFDTAKKTLPENPEAKAAFEHVLGLLNLLKEYGEITEMKKSLIKKFDKLYG